MNTGGIIGSPFKKNVAPCPMCQKHINHGEMSCPHCKHELTANDIHALKQYMNKQQSHGKRLGLIIIPAAILLFTLFFMLLE